MHYVFLVLIPLTTNGSQKIFPHFVSPVPKHTSSPILWTESHISSGTKIQLEQAEIWMLFFSAFLPSTPFYQVNKYSEIQGSKRSHHSNLPLIGKILIASGKSVINSYWFGGWYSINNSMKNTLSNKSLGLFI